MVDLYKWTVSESNTIPCSLFSVVVVIVFLTSSEGTHWTPFVMNRRSICFCRKKYQVLVHGGGENIKNCHKPLRIVFGSLRIRWTVGKICKDKELYICFIQIKWKNKEEVGSDKRRRIEPLFFPFWIFCLGNRERFSNWERWSSKHAEIRRASNSLKRVQFSLARWNLVQCLLIKFKNKTKLFEDFWKIKDNGLEE